MTKHRITFEVDAAKLLHLLSITNEDYGPIGREVIRAMLVGKGWPIPPNNRANLADCGITIVAQDDKT